jgi:hypothetical protein
MIKAKQFRENAKEAIHWASMTKTTPSQKKAFVYLASVWTQFALHREGRSIGRPERAPGVSARSRERNF